MKKLSKISLQIVTNMIEHYAEKEGITPKTVLTILEHVSAGNFRGMTESEASILTSSISNKRILETYPEMMDLYNSVDLIWAKRTKWNVARAQNSEQRVLH